MTQTASALWRRAVALTALLSLLTPLFLIPATAARAQFGNPAPQQRRPGFSTKQKVVALAGAALLYYLYRKYQARQQEQTRVSGNNAAANNANANARPQLYRSKNGGIYYRDAQGKPVWLSAPSRQLSVPQSEVQRYAPDYSRYQNQPAPAAPQGYRTQSFSELDPSLVRGGGAASVPGPAGYR